MNFPPKSGFCEKDEDRKPFATTRAYTLTDLLVGTVLLAALAFVGLFLLPSTGSSGHARGSRINCTCNLKQVGLAFKQWEFDHQDRMPMQVSVTNGGTKEFVNAGATWMHFMVLSNELSTPKVLTCPADKGRKELAATTFGAATTRGQIPFTNGYGVSYFVGVDAIGTNALMFLSGDRNITNNANQRRGLALFPTNQPAGWTADLHDRCGNVGLADGSVQQETTSGLRLALIETSVATNRLAMP